MQESIDSIRAFNRFYTRHIGVLEEGWLKSEFTLTESRVLYELAHRDRPTASEIGKALGLDAGSLSRILAKFQRRKFVRKTASSKDERAAHLELTAAGFKAFSPLDSRAREQL